MPGPKKKKHPSGLSFKAWCESTGIWPEVNAVYKQRIKGQSHKRDEIWLELQYEYKYLTKEKPDEGPAPASNSTEPAQPSSPYVSTPPPLTTNRIKPQIEDRPDVQKEIYWAHQFGSLVWKMVRKDQALIFYDGEGAEIVAPTPGAKSWLDLRILDPVEFYRQFNRYVPSRDQLDREEESRKAGKAQLGLIDKLLNRADLAAGRKGSKDPARELAVSA